MTDRNLFAKINNALVHKRRGGFIMNIAVCDDQRDYLNLIKKKIIECFDEKEIDLKVYTYASTDEFIDSVKEHSYQFAFIEMKVENGKGINTAERLKEVNPACQVVFISDQYRMINEAFQVKAREYLLKPISTEQFKDIFAYLMDWYLEQNIKFVVPIRDIGRKRIFSVDEIKYFETYYNDLEIVTIKDEHYMTHVKNRYKLRPALKSRWFMQVNQSVLVNMKCIDFLTDRNVILKSREVFPTSRKTLIKNHLLYDQFLRYIEKKKAGGRLNENSNL